MNGIGWQVEFQSWETIVYRTKKKRDRSQFQIKCSWCGVLIRANTAKDSEQMCLICYARMLNEYFQKVRNRRDEDSSGAHSVPD